MGEHDDDPVLDALDDLERVLAENAERGEAMLERIAFIRALRSEGLSYREIVPREKVPLIVELLSESARELDRVGAQFRRAEALGLHEEGMTMDEIATAFGVTRQRVSALLREARSVGRAPLSAAVGAFSCNDLAQALLLTHPLM